MNPRTIAKSGSEAAHQTALFAFLAVACQHGFAVAWEWVAGCEIRAAVESYGSRPCTPLKWIYHVPNGGARADDKRGNAIRGGQLKAQGVRAGVSDIFWPYRSGDWSGLYIEMKKPTEAPKREGSKGGVSDEQKEFGDFVKSQGFGFVVCYDWESAARIVQSYFEWGKHGRTQEIAT